MSDEERYFRDQLREARAVALRDSEGFIGICQCLERLAFFRAGRGLGLLRAWRIIGEVALRSPLARDIPNAWPELHPPAKRLYDSVREGRNQAVHEGAYARNLARQAVELSLIIEDALQEHAMLVQDFMVRNPVVAELWEPLSFIRQKMLVNSFSYLPVRVGKRDWRLLSDRSLARYLRVPATGDRDERKERLARKLEEAIGAGVELEPADTCFPHEPATEIASRIGDKPFLVISAEDRDRLLGILTAFDLI